MTNNEYICTLSSKDMLDFLNQHRQYKCINCVYHYLDGSCYDYDCDKGILEWLESEDNENAT